MSRPNSPPLLPTHPFDKSVAVDAILRSSDGADFHIQRTILSLVSPVFEAMFSLPQGASVSTLPVVDFPEKSAALDGALRLFYPGTTMCLDTKSLNELQDIIDLVMKYDMQCLVPTAKKHLEKYHSPQPLAVYAIACRHQWKDVAVAAARECLKHPLRVPRVNAPTEIHSITAVAYYSLLQYHFLCGEAAKAKIASLGWFAHPAVFDACTCVKPQYFLFADNATHWVPEWFSKYLNETRDILLETPGANVRQLWSFNQAVMAAKCNHCRQFDLGAFGGVQLPAQIETEISKVELNF